MSKLLKKKEAKKEVELYMSYSSLIKLLVLAIVLAATAIYLS